MAKRTVSSIMIADENMRAGDSIVIARDGVVRLRMAYDRSTHGLAMHNAAQGEQVRVWWGDQYSGHTIYESIDDFQHNGHGASAGKE